MAIAVLDVGKTNVKLTAFSPAGEALRMLCTPNSSLGTPPYTHVDVDRLWCFVMEGLQALGPLDDIIVTTHGCTAALVRDDALAAPIMDYEWAGVSVVDAAYEALRPPFDTTGSPSLPQGLNLGRQLFYLSRHHPDCLAGAGILPYPQYWAWRLCGEMASDVSSIGCHTDLWDIRAGSYSALAVDQGWAQAFAPIRPGDDVLGTLRAEVAHTTGQPTGTRVRVGIHDSNASIVPYLEREEPFAFVSSGTWAVCFAIGTPVSDLPEWRDCLVNVDVKGNPVACSRFMSGREFDMIVQDVPGARSAEPTVEAAERAVRAGVLLEPSFVPGVGPFPEHHANGLDHVALQDPAQRRSMASVHLALMLETTLSLINAEGPVLLDGPLSADRLVAGLLAGWLGRDVVPVDGGSASAGAAALVTSRWAGRSSEPCRPLSSPLLDDYRARWRTHVGDV